MADITGSTVKPDSRTGSGTQTSHAVMGHKSGCHTCKDVPHAATGHAGIAAGIDIRMERLWRHDNRRRSFQDQRYVPVLHELLGCSDTIFFDICQR